MKVEQVVRLVNEHGTFIGNGTVKSISPTGKTVVITRGTGIESAFYRTGNPVGTTMGTSGLSPMYVFKCNPAPEQLGHDKFIA